MTEAEFHKRVMAGEFLVLAEYRISKAEMLRWRDKDNGKAKEAPMLRHTIEVGNTGCQIQERVPDTITRVEDIKVPFTKGQLVVVFLTELMTVKGNTTLRGTLEKLDK